MEARHDSVLTDEVLTALAIQPSDRVVDATIGGAGHFSKLLSALGSLSMMGAAVSAPPAAAVSAGGNQALSIVKAPNLWTDIAGYGLPK